MRQSLKKRLLRLERYFHIGEPMPNFTAIMTPRSLTRMLQHDDAKKAFALLADSLAPRHKDRIKAGFDKPQCGPLTYYIGRWAQLHETLDSMGPYVIPEKLADWLAALPDQLTGYRPFDVCWDCGCYYPGYWTQPNPNKPSIRREPWLGYRCVHCGGWIVDSSHLPHMTQDLRDNAPFARLRRQKESEWTTQLEQVELAANQPAGANKSLHGRMPTLVKSAAPAPAPVVSQTAAKQEMRGGRPRLSP